VVDIENNKACGRD